jgi:hypothetical protein
VGSTRLGTKSAEARLKFYATKFPLVEVDPTYYYPPSERNSVLWIERTPADFTFNIKAYSLLTNHPTRPDSLYGDVKAELGPDILGERFTYRENLANHWSNRFGSASATRSCRCTRRASSAPSCSSSPSGSRSAGRTSPTSRSAPWHWHHPADDDQLAGTVGAAGAESNPEKQITGETSCAESCSGQFLGQT